MRSEIRKTYRRFTLALAATGLMALFAAAAQAATFHVTTTADNGDNANPTMGSLRKAIKDANANAGLDTIDFNIAGAGVQTISPPAQLPDITDPVVIDGYTQQPCSANPAPCSKPNTLAGGDDAVLLIVLDGSSAGAGARGLNITGGGSTVRGLVISNFSGVSLSNFGSAIYMKVKGGNVIAGNFIGTDPAGLAKAPNSTGINIEGSPDNTIGGTAPADRNLISGNEANGINIFVDGATGNVVQGNFIGTDLTGKAALGNKFNGVQVSNVGTTSSNILIGGTSAGAGNVISGNGNDGILLANKLVGAQVLGNIIGADVTGKVALGNGFMGIEINTTVPNAAVIGSAAAGARNIISANKRGGININFLSAGIIIQGNYIGTDITGNVALGNSSPNIQAAGIASTASDGGIGGAAPGAGNVIAANSGPGISIFSSGTNNLVQGNKIGVGADGVTPLGNGFHGVFLQSSAGHNEVGGGGGAGNLIAFNKGAGVSVGDGTQNEIRLNSITGNDGPGIDLNSDGVTQNDQGDGDSGPNNLQNFPAITSATTSGGDTAIKGVLNSTPGTVFRLEFFSNDAPDVSGFGEGQTLVGFMTVTTDASGNASFNATFAGVPTGQFISATATDLLTGNTSEFSLAMKLNQLPPALSINDASLTEGNSGTKNAAFTVTLSSPFSLPVTVDYATANGTAAAPGDYAAQNGTLTFDPGQTTQTVNVAVNGDTTPEPDETFSVNLSNATNATISKGKGTGTIQNDDALQPGTLSFTVASLNVNENSPQATITVKRTGGSDGPVSVLYATTSGTATAGSDYNSASGVLSWADGDSGNKTFSVPILDDQLNEPDETINLALSSPTGGATLGLPSALVLTIKDNDPTPQLAVTDASHAEGDSGTTDFVFTVQLTAASGKTVTVNYATQDGSAQGGSDYQSVSGTLTFAPGETSKDITVSVNGDTQLESNETFTLGLSSPSNATTSKAQGTGTIVNDDVVAPQAVNVQFEQSGYSVSEGDHYKVINVTRTGGTSADVSVDYASADGTAQQRTDYNLLSGTLHFAPGETTKTLTLLVTEDSYVEGAETLTLSLSNPHGATLGSQSQAQVTITDNDTDPNAQNAITDVENFVRQQYHDFLNREPDPPGFQGWQDTLKNCAPGDMKCDRIEVSSAFYRSLEFHDRGYFIFRFYSAALGRNPHYEEFMHDLQKISGFMSQQELDQAKVDFITEFMGRAEFQQKYGQISDAGAYVDMLAQTAGVSLSARNQIVQQLLSGQITRGQALRAVVESTEVDQKFYNQGFVVMQYFGYLRREPDILYLEWLDTLNQTNDYRLLVNGFLNSVEYSLRFGN